MTYQRNRLVYFLLCILVMTVGLASRKMAYLVPELMRPYLGDVLWALMVFLGLGFVFSRLSTLKLAILALAFSFAIEVSQLYHAPWIDGLRHTVIGGLVLGFGFLWSDLLCYMVGIGFGVLMEKSFRRAFCAEQQP